MDDLAPSPAGDDTGAAAGEARPREHLPRGGEFLLWPPALQVYGYRIVDRLFATRAVPRAPTPARWARGPELGLRYGAGGSLSVDDFMDRNQVAGLLVVKDGRIVLERYGLGLREDDRWSTMSTVKSITAMLAGAALHDGALRSLDDRVTDHLPQMAGSAYDGVTVRHLLTMSSGVAWNEDYADRESDVNRYSRSLADRVPGGVFRLLRALPRRSPPGAEWNYHTGDTFLLGALIVAATGRRLADYLAERVWQPCGMEFDAFYTLESEDGQEIGGSRAGVALRDFGRFAQFVLDGGRCGDRQVLPPGWVDDAERPAFALTPAWRQRVPGLTGYGYGWWLDGHGGLSAEGFAGQRIWLDRRARLAIVTLSAFTQPPYLSAAEPDRPAELRAFTDAVRAALR